MSVVNLPMDQGTVRHPDELREIQSVIAVHVIFTRLDTTSACDVLLVRSTDRGQGFVFVISLLLGVLAQERRR